MKKKILFAAAASVAATLVLSSCAGISDGADSNDAAGPITLYGHTVEVDPALADRVPEDWAKDGISVPIQVLMPNAVVDEDGETVGMQPDLLNAIGAKLGIKVEMEVTSFDAQIPGVQAGRYTMTTGTGDFVDRREILDMVDYLRSGIMWVMSVETREGMSDVEDICDMTIGVIAGGANEMMAEKFSETVCQEKGLATPTIVPIGSTIMTVPLEAGQVDVIYENIPSGMNFLKSEPDKWTSVGDPAYMAPIAFGLPKGSDDKVSLIQDTIQALVDDGVYDAIFEEWGLSNLAMKVITTNSDDPGASDDLK